MTHYDELIKAEKMGYFSDYETLLFARAKGKIKSITGVLPLTFTAKGGTAVDWVIFGNDDVGENLFDINDLEQGAIDPATGRNTDVTGFKRTTNYISLDVGGNYYMTAPNGGIRIFRYTSDKSYVSSYLHTQAKSLELGANIKYIRMAATANNYPNNLMLVKGSTAPDHYIPYQQGVGERTENLFDYSQGCDWVSGSNGASNQKITAQQGNVFTVKSTSALYALVRGYDANDAIISGSAWSTGGTSTYTAPANIAYLKVVFRNFDYSTITAEQKATINEAMLVKGSTAPTTYIPYGYQIPLTVTSGTESKTVDIYIGDSPLTEGETVSKTSTGVDIELFEGENTVSTTLYNKPEMKIDYE